MSAASASSRPRCMIAGSARRAFTQRAIGLQAPAQVRAELR